MDACTGDVEVPTHKGRHGGDVIADLVLEVVGDLGDGGGVHAVQRATERGVFKHHGLQRHIAGALTDAQHGTVHAAGAVQPGGGGVGNGLVEVIVAVPFQIFALHAGIVLQTVDNAGDAAGQGHLCIGDAVAHSVAGPDTDGDLGLVGKLHQLVDEGHHEAVKVRTGDVLQMASGHDPGVKGVLHRGQIVVQRLPAGHLHFLEDVVVAARHQNTGLLDAKVLHHPEVLPGGPDPSGDLREAQPQSLTAFDGLPVPLAVNEKLRLADQAVRPAQLAQQLEQVLDLLRRVGVHGLLTISEGGVRDPDIGRHGCRHPPVVKGHLGDLVIVIYVPVQHRVLHILKGITVVIFLQQIGFGG